MHNRSLERGVRKNYKKLQTQRSMKEGRKCSRHQNRDFPVHGQDRSGAGCPPGAHGVPFGADLHAAAHARAHARAGGCDLKDSTAHEVPMQKETPG